MNFGSWGWSSDRSDKPEKEDVKMETDASRHYSSSFYQVYGGDNDTTDFSKMTRLTDFGYDFDSSGRLRSTNNGSAFRFDVYGRKKDDQAHYEALGKVINNYVYYEMETLGLRRIPIPLGAPTGAPSGFFFASTGAETAETLLVLVHGSGGLRAGQWSRRLIINRSLDAGSQLPLIRQALANKWGVVCLNSNQWEDDRGRPIPGSEDPARHGVTVWRKWIATATQARRIGIVAHSAGGGVTGDMANRNRVDFEQRVKAVALTDAFCPPNPIFSAVARHWVCSEYPLDTTLRRGKYGGEMEELSAGTTVHEEATFAAQASIWRFLKEKLESNGRGARRPLCRGGSHDAYGVPLYPQGATKVHSSALSSAGQVYPHEHQYRSESSLYTDVYSTGYAASATKSHSNRTYGNGDVPVAKPQPEHAYYGSDPPLDHGRTGTKQNLTSGFGEGQSSKPGQAYGTGLGSPSYFSYPDHGYGTRANLTSISSRQSAGPYQVEGSKKYVGSTGQRSASMRTSGHYGIQAPFATMETQYSRN